MAMRIKFQSGMRGNVQPVQNTTLRSAIFLLLTIGVFGCRSAELRPPHFLPPYTSSDQHRLEGVWRFQKEVDAKLNGEIVVIPGPSYEGLLAYTSDGFVSTILMPKGRAWDAATATVEQLRESVSEGSSTADAGRYEIDSVTHTVTHTIVVSVDPADEGSRLTRHYAFEGDNLLLSGDWSYRGEALRFTVYWVRAN
jgi:hypothetical protein